MSAPSAGKRRSAAKAGTACWCCPRARSSGSSSEPAPRPLPKIFRLTKSGKLIDGIFKGETINTPSMLAVEDWLVALDWAERVGGLSALIARADANAAALDRWVAGRRLDRASRRRPGDPLEHLGLPAIRRPLRRGGQQGAAEGDRRNCSRQEGAAFDIGAYRDAPPGLRIWCGATVDTADIEALGPWLDWAWETDQMSVRVLISDQMDPKAAAIFRERGIEVDEITGQIARRTEGDHRRL